MQVNFGGVRGSYPCWGEGKNTIGGQTSCISVSLEGQTTPVIFDMGSGIIEFGRQLLAENVKDIIIIISHFHLDHVMGIPFFKPLWNPETNITFYSPDVPGQLSLKAILQEKLFSAPLFPIPFDDVPATCHFKTFNPGDEVSLGEDALLKSFSLNHPGSATGYRLEHRGKSFCYITDHEQSEEYDATELVHFVKESDLMVFDTMYTPHDMTTHVGWGHSSWQNAVDVALSAQVKKLALFHTSPDYDDEQLLEIEASAHEAFTGTFLAREGSGIEI